jgi:thioredoxin reductase (NADPH)
VRLRDLRTDALSTLEVGALFVAIGHEPNTTLFRGVLDMNPSGYLEVQPHSTRTNVAGVFACGDAMDPHYRQAVTAAGSGCMAALDAERWLAANE